MNEEKKYLDEISAKQLIDSTKEYVQNEIDGIETLGIQYNEEESALEFVGGSVITGSDSGSGGASSKEYSLIENKLYINPTGNSIGMNTITCSTGTLGSVFDKTSVEIMTNFVVKESTEDAVVYNIDKIEIGTRTGTALGAFDGRFVKIFVGAYLLDILEKIKSDGTISYITTYEPRKDIISPVEKTDEMTQEVGLDSNTGKLFTAPGGGGGASSWNDLTDRPFYSEFVVNETALEEQEVTFSVQDGMNVGIIDGFNFTYDEKEDECFILSINNKKHACNVKTYAYGENIMKFIWIGNLSLYSPDVEDTGEDFVFVTIWEDSDVLSGTALALNESKYPESIYTIKLEKATETIKRIPEKYISEKIVFTVSGTVGQGATVTCNVDGYALKSMDLKRLIDCIILHDYVLISRPALIVDITEDTRMIGFEGATTSFIYIESDGTMTVSNE